MTEQKQNLLHFSVMAQQPQLQKSRPNQRPQGSNESQKFTKPRTNEVIETRGGNHKVL